MKRPDAIRVVPDPIAQPEDGTVITLVSGGYVIPAAIVANVLADLENGTLEHNDAPATAACIDHASAPGPFIALDAAGGGTVTLRNGETLQIVSGALSITLD